MGDSFRVYYMFRGKEKTKDFNDWLSVILFIDETENIHGGYIYLIDVNGQTGYIRTLDEENGSDQWFSIDGREVTLEREYRSKV